MKKINPKKIVSCASVFVAGLCGSARAEYPDHCFLWNRLVYGSGYKSDNSYKKGVNLYKKGVVKKGVVNCPIPGVYKELLKIWNEEAGANGMLSEEARREKGFKPFWEDAEGKSKIRRGGVNFEFYAYLPQCGGPARLSFPENGRICGTYERDYYGQLSVEGCTKKAIRRCTHVVSSEVFLREVLGGDYVDAFINECNKKEGNPMLTVKYILYPVGYQRARGIYLREEKRYPRELYKNTLDRFWSLPKGFWSQCMDHIVVDMEIYQTHRKIEGQDGKLVKVPDSRYREDAKTFIDFQLCLKLIFDMKKEKVETVAMYDTFIVNRGISHFGKNCFNVFFGNPNKYFPSFKGRWLK